MTTKTQNPVEALTAEDLAFLTALANELKTQDTAHTRKPVIYQIVERAREVGVEEDYADGPTIGIGDDGAGFYDDDVAGAREYLMNLWEFDAREAAELKKAKTLEDIAQFCADRDDIRYVYTGYRDTETFKGFFLTKAALKRHIESNKHHYSNPVSYAQAAGWRNPELERLLTIIEKFATVEEVSP